MATRTTCDLCGSSKNVKAPWISLWNGTKFDLCRVCVWGTDLGKLIDEVGARIARREAGVSETPPDQGAVA